MSKIKSYPLINNSLFIISLIIAAPIFAAGTKFHPPVWSKNAVIYEVNVRQYTKEGTFKAFEKHLPELKKMGVDILWLMPVNPIGVENRKGSLGSYYSVKDYNAVNPEFGTVDDFKHLVAEVHKLNMHLIVDWVANHTSWDNVWTKTHPEYYNKNSEGKFFPPVADWQDVIDLNYDNKDLRQAMINAMNYWVKDCGIDGFRCDVAAMVPIDFWIEARTQLSKTKNVFMLAEANEPFIHKAFDMTYNWQLKDVFNEIGKGKKNAADIKKYFEQEKKEYKPGDYRMVFTSNHDENTWQGTEFERLGDGAEMFAVMCGTVPGMPLIYTGQEIRMNKRLRFFDKDTIDWKADQMREIYTKLNHLKKVNRALWNGEAGGDIKFLETGNENVLAFIREKGASMVFSLFNVSPKNENVKIETKELMPGLKNLFDKDDKLKIKEAYSAELGPWKYKVYYK